MMKSSKNIYIDSFDDDGMQFKVWDDEENAVEGFAKYEGKYDFEI